MTNSPANGDGIPPNVSHGEALGAFRSLSAARAWAAVSVRKLDPSMNTRPARSRAPGFPPKFHVAYAATTDPPSE